MALPKVGSGQRKWFEVAVSAIERLDFVSGQVFGAVWEGRSQSSVEIRIYACKGDRFGYVPSARWRFQNRATLEFIDRVFVLNSRSDVNNMIRQLTEDCDVAVNKFIFPGVTWTLSNGHQISTQSNPRDPK